MGWAEGVRCAKVGRRGMRVHGRGFGRGGHGHVRWVGCEWGGGGERMRRTAGPGRMRWGMVGWWVGRGRRGGGVVGWRCGLFDRCMRDGQGGGGCGGVQVLRKFGWTRRWLHVGWVGWCERAGGVEGGEFVGVTQGGGRVDAVEDVRGVGGEGRGNGL